MAHTTTAYLCRHTEDVGVILYESTHTRQTSERARRFIPVHDTELRHPDGELLVATVPGVKDETVARAVHRLESPLLLLDVECEHVVFVVLPMPRRLPKF